MKTKHTFWLSLLIGAILEGALWSVGAFARFGPCGPGNWPAEIFMLGHLPGFYVVEFLHMDRPLGALEIITTVLNAAFFSLLSFLVISVIRRFRAHSCH